MAYTNGNGQIRVGVRTPGVSPVITASTLLTSLYSVWNGDTLGTTLDSSIFGAWNGEKNGTSLDSGIVGAWHGENNVNDSVGTNHGTAVGGLTYSTGKIGQTFNFNGSSCVDLGDIMDIGTKNWSYSMWIKTNVVSGFTTIFSKAMNESFGGRFGILTSNNFIKVFFDPTGSNTITADSSISISTNTWYHLVFQIDRSDKLKLYINGVLNNIVTKDGVNNLAPYLSSDYNRPTTFKLGAYTNTNGTPTQFFNGQIDAFSVWDRLLTADEVTQLYNAGNGTQYPFSTQTLPSSIDSVGTNHGTLQSGMSMDLGKIGSAFKSNGTSNAYLTLPDNSLSHTTSGDFSISLWVKFASMSSPATGGQQYPISYMSSTTNGWYILNGSTFRIANGTTNVDLNASAMTAGVWRHIVITRKYGTRTRFYVDGVLSNSNTSTINPSSGTFFPTIGAYRSSSSASSGYCTNGTLIDAVTTWSKELSDDEVVQLYNAGNGTQYPFGSQTLPSVANQFGVDNGTLMNGCTFGDGKIGKAFTFDGVNDYVKLPNNSLNFTGDFSVSFWIYLTSGGPQTILSNEYYNNPSIKGWGIYIDNMAVGQNQRNLQFIVYRNTTSDYIGYMANSVSSLNINQWNHCVIVRKSGVDTYMYINGSLVTTTLTGSILNRTLDPLYNSTQYVSMGADIANSSGTSYSNYIKNGSKIDSFNVWQKELTQDEVTELYNSGNGKQLTIDTKIVTSGLVLNLDASRKSSYPNTGTTWFDISGNGYNGTMINGVAYGATASGVMTFDGINDYINMGNQSAITPGSGSFTYEFWINPQSFSAQYVPILTTTITNGLWIGKINSNFVLRSYNVVDDIQCSLPTTGNWTNIVVTRSNGIAKIYYNNLLVASASNTKTYTSSTTEIGRDGTTNVFFGSMASVRYYNRELSDSEITQNFNATKSRFGL